MMYYKVFAYFMKNINVIHTLKFNVDSQKLMVFFGFAYEMCKEIRITKKDRI